MAGTILKVKTSLILLMTSLFWSSIASACYESSIVKPVPFMGNDGEIFVLSDGSVWEIKYEYEYMYEYNPSIIACPEKGIIVINKKKLNAKKIK
jgi:hypothetical protein